MSEENREYISPALNAAIALHEMFTTLIQAGFNERQALVIVTEMLKGTSPQ